MMDGTIVQCLCATFLLVAPPAIITASSVIMYKTASSAMRAWLIAAAICAGLIMIGAIAASAFLWRHELFYDRGATVRLVENVYDEMVAAGGVRTVVTESGGLRGVVARLHGSWFTRADGESRCDDCSICLEDNERLHVALLPDGPGDRVRIFVAQEPLVRCGRCYGVFHHRCVADNAVFGVRSGCACPRCRRPWASDNYNRDGFAVHTLRT